MKKFSIKSLCVILSILTAIMSLPMTAFALDLSDNTASEIVESSSDVLTVQKDIIEMTDMRTASVKYFRLEDGSYYAAQYDSAVHYQDENGDWQDIDNTLAVSGSEITTSNAKIKFAKKTTGNSSLFTLHDGNRKLTLSLDGAAKKIAGEITNYETEFGEDATKLQKMTTLDKINASVIYRDILPGVDLEYVVTGLNIKENIIVKEQSSNYSYSFTMQLNNLTAILNEKGEIIISEPSSDEAVYIIPAPVMWDANNVTSDKATMSLTDNGNGKYTLVVTADSDWMNAEERTYPVTVDPPISVPSASTIDLDISSVSPDRSSPYDSTMYVSSTWKSYWKTNELPSLPSSAHITSAYISLISTSTNGNYVGVHQVTSNWDSSLTWNKTLAATPAGSYNSNPLDYKCISMEDADITGRFYWDITSLVRSWYSGTPNYGVTFQPVSGTTVSGNSVFFSSESEGSGYYPQFAITYRDMKGVESYWTYATQNAGLAGTGSINYATGSLTFTKSLLSTTDSLMQYTPMIVYNSALANNPHEYPFAQSSYWSTYMPVGFKLNINETLIQKSYVTQTGENVDYYIWSDADGTEHYFLPVNGSTTTYRDEDGLQLTLTVNSSSCTITDSANTVRTFSTWYVTISNQVLSGWYLTSITDKNNNKIVFSFDSKNRPIKISLIPNGFNQIDFLEISYNGDGLPYVIWNPTSKEAIIFRYSASPTGNIVTSNTSYLRQLIYAHGNSYVTATDWLNFYNSTSGTNITIDATAYYTYNSSGYLISAKDGLSNYEIEYNYTNGKVTEVQEYGANSDVGQKLGITYYSGYTETRSSGSDDEYDTSDDIYTRFVLDNNGRTITSYSTNLDRTEFFGISSGEYETENDMAANSLKVSTTTGNRSANYLLNGDFEKSDSAVTEWYSTGAVYVSALSLVGFGENCAALDVSAGTTSSIYQYVYLREGEYTLSLNVDAFSSNNVSIKIIAQSMTDPSRVFEKEVPHNKYYAGNTYAFDFFTFSANSGEIFKISVVVEGHANLTKTVRVDFDNIMLSKSSGTQPYNMVQNSDFENTHVYSNGSVRYAPTSFWSVGEESSIANYSLVTATSPFNKALQFGGNVNGKNSVEQTIYSASSLDLSEYDDNIMAGVSDLPQHLLISGFGKATSIMHSNSSRFALRLDVTYYYGEGRTETESKYFDFCEDTTNWQYVSGTFTIPAYYMVKEIKICCEYSGNIGYAYFDDISVVLDSEGATTQYEYDDKGRTILSLTGSNAVVYSYDQDGNLYDKITRSGRTVYSYDASGRLLTEKYYTYAGYFAYLAEYSDLIQYLGQQTLKMQATYEYTNYGLLKKSTIYSSEENEVFITQTSYNDSQGSKIFGSIQTTTDSLGKVTRYFYDSNNGRLLANIQPDNTGTSYSYDAVGNLTLVQPATYSAGSWSGVSNSANVVYEYNELNQLTSINTEGTEYSFTYNNFGAKNSVAIGGTTIVSQTYNDYNGKISKVTYANGTVVNYFYDELARVEKIVYNDNGVETVYEYEYDSNGNLSKFIDHSTNRVSLYQYDGSGRLINFVEYDSYAYENLVSAKYWYDDYSRLRLISYRQDYKYNSTDHEVAAYTSSYTYNENNIVKSYATGFNLRKYNIQLTIDGHNRVDSKTINFRTEDYNITTSLQYAYKASGSNGSADVSKYTSQIGSSTAKEYNFTYDSANANITKVTDANGTILNQYTYDSLGRLTREDNYRAGNTYVYTYDSDGNILTKKTYIFTTASGKPTTTLLSTYNYTYGNSNWGDQLTSYRGSNLIYDAVGNPTSYYNGSRMYMSWVNGNNLASVTKNSVTTTYTYNDGGIRTSKTVDGVLHKYLLDGSVILSEEYDGKLFIYLYDENGAPIGIHYREASYDKDVFDCYLFEKNFQGDIIGIYDESGTQVVWYEYDAWGKRVDGSYAAGYSDLYNANPFRYRGYYYDSETGFYYCGSRYYDPVTGRFINADSTNTLMNTPMAYTDKNLYAYCDNNPVMRVDNGGEFWDTVFDVVSLCFSVADVIKNPDDPWAWVGLAADVVSLVVPFATGGGLIVDVVTKADDVIDLAKTVDNVADSADAVYDGIKVMGDIDIPDCFVAGTLVATMDGHSPIETIEVGDYVWATDPDTGETKLKLVVNTFINETSAVTHIKVSDEVITSTQTHPYYVANKGWVLARNLRAGDILVMLNGEQVVIELVQHELLESAVVTYNFEVEGIHTYYVGSSSVLVHNKCFRGNLMDLTGYTDEMAAGLDAHHVFPQKFRDEFTKIVGNNWIDNPYYGSWWELHDHRKHAKAYNKLWEKFLKTNPTFDDILDYGIELSNKFGFKVNFH